jgi:integrase
MATIRSRKNKHGAVVWQAIIRKLGQQSISKTFDYKEDAQRWARAIEREMDTSTFIPSSEAERTTVADVLDRYKREVFPRLAREGKAEQARLDCLKVGLGKHNLSSLTAAHVAQHRDSRMKEVSAQTVRHEIGLLNRVLKHCVMDWGIHLKNGVVTENVHKPALPSGRDRRLSPDEETRLRTALRNSRSPEIEAIVIIALETAARRGEIFKMAWQHIDLKKKTWHIPETKTGVPRTVPLSSRAVEVLEKIPRNINGRVWKLKQENGVTQAFERICKTAKIDDLRFHDLRHESTSRLFERGFSMMEVASITGHQDLKMLKRYTHLKAEDLVERLG